MAGKRGAGTKHHFHFSKTFTFSYIVSNPQGSTSPRYTKYDLDQALNRNPRTTWLCLWVGYHCAGACAPSKPKLASNQPSAALATLSNTFYLTFLLFSFFELKFYKYTFLHFLTGTLMTAHSSSHKPMFMVKLSQSHSNPHERESSIV